MRRLPQTLLVLGRVSNLPTVWSNCLLGWMLADGASHSTTASLWLLCASCSLLYVAGMYLNDVCDVDFDSAHRPERPIPAGAIGRFPVLVLSVILFMLGLSILLTRFPNGALWSLALTGLIVLYDLVHKHVAFAPVLMAGCRVLIYPLAAATTARDEPSLKIGSGILHEPLLWWAAAAMGAWILTLSVLARTEAKPGSFRKPALLLLGLPLLIGWLTQGREAILAEALLCSWILLSVNPLLRDRQKVGATVGNLLAGIPLVDLIVAAELKNPHIGPFLCCMLLALVLRRNIPPT